jgi:RHS repeat-associated protein
MMKCASIFKKFLCLIALLFPYVAFSQKNVSTYNNEIEISAPVSVTLSNGFHAPLGSTLRVFTSGLSYVNCVPLSASVSNNQNYILTRTFKKAGVTNDNLNSSRLICDENRTIQYIDGLGRVIQSVSVQGSPNLSDLIQPFSYDAMGRANINYQMYTAGGINGSYRSDALIDGAGLKSYYANPPTGIKNSAAPFSVSVFEQNPLGRIVETGAQGIDWQPVPNSSSGHTHKNEYGFNTGQEVRKWTTTSLLNSASSVGFYSAGALSKKISKDENWISGNKGVIEEFSDFQGQIVLRRVWESDTISLSTYYVYDELGKLRYVLPPAVNENGLLETANTYSFNENDTVFKNYIYASHYDDQNRLVEKAIPGKGWEHMVYNKKDQLVLSQDEKQRSLGEWIYFKYDVFGREVVSGILSSSQLRAAMQNTVNNQSVLWESRINSDQGYSNNAYPQNTANYLSIKYYDDYIFPGNTYGGATNGQADGVFIKTLLTGQKLSIIGSTSMLLSVNYYDLDGRVVQIKKQSHIGDDIVDKNWNFNNELIETLRTHNGHGVQTKIKTKTEFDHMGRVLATKKSINDQDELFLNKMEYNDIGQLLKKKLHSVDGTTFGQQIDYAYNERGWITGINDPTQLDPSRVFGMAITYAANADTYNGNIAALTWRTQVPSGYALNDGIQGFNYQYDKLNRLTKGSYVSTGKNDFFNEEISYDVMGNIVTLKRNGNSASSYINDMVFNYRANGQPGNQLWGVVDNGTAAQGSNYNYDVNGNQTVNSRIGVTDIAYNYLNLPQVITRAATGEALTTTYDAGGKKLRKSLGTQITDYIDGIQYNGNNIDFVMTEEGRAIPGAPYTYQYFLKDHLGNTRSTVGQDGSILQVQDYYPFGLNMNANNTVTPSPANQFKFNGKEELSEFGAGQLDFSSRYYDPLIGRFSGIDRLATGYAYKSPYDYAENRPVNGIDLDGLEWTSTVDKQGNSYIKVNTNFSFEGSELLPDGITMKDYQNAINSTFDLMFQTSSKGNVHGLISFDGGDEKSLGVFVPKLSIYAAKLDPNEKISIAGLQGPGIANINLYNKNGTIKTPTQLAWDVAHEILHTIRLDHPFERTQTTDTKLSIASGKDNYSSDSETDPRIGYNIMNYPMLYIDGKRLGDLWKDIKTLELTPQQIEFIYREIGLQQQGMGTIRADYMQYWGDFPGTPVIKK